MGGAILPPIINNPGPGTFYLIARYLNELCVEGVQPIWLKNGKQIITTLLHVQAFVYFKKLIYFLTHKKSFL